jgi:hypothetical protein
MNIHCSYLNCCTIFNLKTRRRSKTFKGSQRMGGGWIFLKTFGASLFNEDLSNEPNSGRIHRSDSTFKGIFQPFELGAESSLIRSAVKFFKAGHLKKKNFYDTISREELKTN